jgi:A/G-specific adenine glycosylase
LRWFARHARDLPWRRTLDPYAIWVSEIMLQQTQVKTVLPYWTRWMQALPTVQALARAPQDRVLKLWEGLGYYTRARHLHQAAQWLAREHRGSFPSDFDALLALPGVGRYTAGAIASIAFNQPAPILDGNVIRVLTRLFGITGNPREKPVNARLWTLAEDLVRHAANFQFSILNLQFSISGPCSALNQSLMELGALVCVPRQPRCAQCPVRRHCAALQQGTTDQLPNLDARHPATTRHVITFLVQHRGRWLVRQRPAGVVNAHLWEFPNFDVTEPARGKASRRRSDGEAAALARELLGHAPKSLTPLTTVVHSITRHRIEVEAYRVTPDGGPRWLAPTGRWLTPRKVESLALPSTHRKLWRLVQTH